MFIKKEQFYQNNNLEESYTEKKAKYERSGCAMFTKCSFDKKENKLDYCGRKDCIKISCKKLKKCPMKIINYEKKEMTPLTKEENKSYKEQGACHICKEKLRMDKDDENYKMKEKLKIIVIIQENLEELLIANAT